MARIARNEHSTYAVPDGGVLPSGARFVSRDGATVRGNRRAGIPRAADQRRGAQLADATGDTVVIGRDHFNPVDAATRDGSWFVSSNGVRGVDFCGYVVDVDHERTHFGMGFSDVVRFVAYHVSRTVGAREATIPDPGQVVEFRPGTPQYVANKGVRYIVAPWGDDLPTVSRDAEGLPYVWLIDERDAALPPSRRRRRTGYAAALQLAAERPASPDPRAWPV